MKYLLVFTFIVATIVVGVERTFADTIPGNNSQGMGSCNEFTFDATSSFDPDNQALTFHWDFGDGNTSVEPVITHRYTAGGDYNVILSVQDSSGLHCDTAVSSQLVTVNTPPIADFTGPNSACTSQSVTFNASGSTDNEQSQITYHWEFGDGTSSEGSQVTKAYERGGRYNVLLSVNDNANTTCSTDSIGKVIYINTKPIANAGDDVDLCLQPHQDYNVSFNGSGSVDEENDPLTYRWDFGDGTSGDGASVTHLYQNKGEYVATLYVDDSTGTACSSSADTVHVKLNRAPVADAGPNHVCCLNTVSEFDGAQSYDPDGDNLTYTWDFGDGATGDGAQVTHIYSTIGKFLVTLTVNDNSGTSCDSATDSFTAVVNATPTSIIKIR